jgi:hypothetical protein
MIMDDTVGKKNKKAIGHSNPHYTSENINLMGRDPF